MRERILEAIYKKLEENPDSTNLQRQITLLNKASICTIHSFCLEVIRNHFYEIDASANFRIGDTAEVEMLKADVLDELLEQKYMENSKEFIRLLDTYTDYRGDDKLQEIVLNVYKYIQSNPFPEQWLTEKLEAFNSKENTGFGDTIWGSILLKHKKEEINTIVLKLEKLKRDILKYPELVKNAEVLQEDIDHLKAIPLEHWDEAYEAMHSVSWAKWPSNKVTLAIKEEAQKARTKLKKEFNNLVLTETSEEAWEDLQFMYGILKTLCELVLEFSKQFATKKKEKNMLDFNDIEHFALRILVDENGEPTEVAKQYQEKWQEILIDEYQDSNLVQEKILTSVSKGNNIFMVGDVKQSIYKFRQARPELFLEKYAKYDLKSGLKKDSAGLKIQLFKNFRSRKNILDITNLVFENIMSGDMGDVDYNETEYLNYGADYPEPEEEIRHAGIAELHIIDLKEEEEDYFTKTEKEATQRTVLEMATDTATQDTVAEAEQSKNRTKQTESQPEVQLKEQATAEEKKQQKTEQQADQALEEAESEDNDERVEDVVLEARFVAKKIQELLQSDYYVYDKKKGYRPIQPKDICVLLRATSTLAPIYEKEIAERGYPVFSDSSSTYLESMEIETMLSLLKVIDNPMQDIPLVTVLRSNIFNFTDNDLMQIRLVDKQCRFYEAMQKARISVDTELRHKIATTIEKIQTWKAEEKYMALDELIWKIYLDTGFYHYVSLLPNGGLRQANLKMLFEKAKQYEKASFKGLFNFIHFMDKVKTNSGDMSAAKVIGENDDVVRIMSIHKSKGLEFPVVILACCGKNFNMQDLNTPILLHQEVGFGPQLIDTEKKVEYSSLAKEAIRKIARVETISEEMRVLYVALTRAKEKLILVGKSRDLEKSLKEKEDMLEIYEERNPWKEETIPEEEASSQKETFSKNKLNPSLVGKYTSYLDWLELVYQYNKGKEIENVLKLYSYKKGKLLKELKGNDAETEAFAEKIEEKAKQVEQKEDEKKYTAIIDYLKWQYPYLASSKIPTKTSVTKLKALEGENEQDIETLIAMAKQKEKQQTTLTVKPKFLEEVQKLNAAQKGTLMHLCVQKLDEKREYTWETLKAFVQEMQERNIISKIEAESVDMEMLYRYTQSSLWHELKEAKEIHKEEPFYITIPAKDIFEEAEASETILVQGIIDLYYINKEGKLILVDYKTDYVPNGDVSKLEEKYKVQLELYKKALENATGEKVEKAIIWALNM